MQNIAVWLMNDQSVGVASSLHPPFSNKLDFKMVHPVSQNNKTFVVMHLVFTL